MTIPFSFTYLADEDGHYSAYSPYGMAIMHAFSKYYEEGGYDYKSFKVTKLNPEDHDYGFEVEIES